jgi:hypothetical protein
MDSISSIPDKITDPTIEDREIYIADLSGYIADRASLLGVPDVQHANQPEIKSFPSTRLERCASKSSPSTFCTDNRS